MSDEPEETEYYLRLVSMYMDLGTETVLDVFAYHSPGNDPKTFLKSKEETLVKLKTDRILNKQECELLLEEDKTADKQEVKYKLKRHVDIKGFDISLIITLSINLFTEQQLKPPRKGWGNPPRNKDKSIAADLLRLRTIRNVIVGHHSNARLPKWRFDEEWKNVSEILLRLQQQISQGKETVVKERIEAYRSQIHVSPLEKEYHEKLSGWQEEVSKAQDQVEDLLKKLEKTLQKTKDCLRDMITRGLSFKKSHDLELKMITLGSDEEKKILAEEILTEVWLEALDRSTQTPDFANVKKEVEKILKEIKKSKDVKNIDIKKACIVMQISCTSPSDMLNIISYFESKEFHEALVNISKELGYYINTALSVYSVIPIECLLSVLNCQSDPAQPEESGIRLPITVSSPAGMLQLRSLFNSEKIANSTNAISDALSKHLDETITLEVGTDMKVFSSVFDEDKKSSDSCSDSSSSESTLTSSIRLQQFDDPGENTEERSKKNINEVSTGDKTAGNPMGSMTTDDEYDVLWQLLYSQKEAARFLQLGYLSLKQFPEVAEQIRMAADQAQTQHRMSVGLVKEFKSTANHVITRTVPILKKGIEKKASKLVQASFKKLLEYVEQMIKKTENTKQQYALIKSMVQKNISCVNKKRDDVKKKRFAIDSVVIQHMQELEVARDEYWDLQAQRQKKEKEIDDFYQTKHKFLNQAVPSGVAKATATAAVGTAAAFTAALLPGAILVGGWMNNYIRRKKESERVFKASDVVAKDLKMAQERDDKIHARILAIKEESIKKIRTIKKNIFIQAFLGDTESLVEAQRQLENVGKHFQHILKMWIELAAQLKHLSQNKDDAELLFIDFEEQPQQFVGELNKSVEDVEEAWNGFMDDCIGYSEESDLEKDQLYGFLSEPVDELSIKECEKKRDAILAKMESELENVPLTSPGEKKLLIRKMNRIGHFI